QVDWCSFDPHVYSNGMDRVFVEYKGILAKYDIHCLRYKVVYSERETCEAALANAEAKCYAKEYSKATLLPAGGESCFKFSYSDKPDRFAARFRCENYRGSSRLRAAP